MSSKFQLRSLVCYASLTVFFFWWQCKPQRVAAQSALDATASQRLSRFDMAHIKSGDSYCIGLNAKNAALVITNINPSYNVGKLSWLNVKTGKVARALANSKVLTAELLQISPDGKTMSDYDNVGDINRKELDVRYIRLLDSSNARLLKTLDIGRQSHVHNIFFHPQNSNVLLVTATSEVPYEGDFTQAKDRIEFWNWRQGKRYKTLFYQYARNINDILISPDGKLLACFFFSAEKFAGSVEFLNSSTGKLVWGVDAKRENSIDAPNFFLSQTKLVCNNQIYDLKNRSIKPLLKPGDKRLKCVSGVESHLGMAFFTTKQGLELWSLSTNKLIHRWPVKTVDYVNLSPDRNVLAVYNGSIVEFWRFNPQWLK